MIKKLLLTAIPLLSAVIAPGANGTLCLTFDDIYLSSWLQAMPLFAKYNAHATFFISRKIDGKNVEQIPLPEFVPAHGVLYMELPETRNRISKISNRPPTSYEIH